MNEFYPPSPVEPLLSEIETATQQRARKLRWMEWGLVMAVAFWEPLFAAIYTFLPASGGKLLRNVDPSIMAGYAVVRDVLALSVLVYVLFRQNRNLRSIGFNWRWCDIPTAFGLMLTVVGFRTIFIGFAISWVPVADRAEFIKHLHPANIPDFHLTLLPLLMMIVNPFYEELLLRAFTQSELTDLTGSAWLAAIAGVTIQVSFHFYQGVFIALTYIPVFGTFAVYYLLKRRIMPVILCHMYFDVTALIALSQLTQHAR